jgi:hypothetical protein
MAKTNAKAAVAAVASLVGSLVEFKGFPEGVELPENGDLLEIGAQYEVVEQVEDENGIVLVLSVDNPDFNPKKKESNANPKVLNVEVFETEVEAVEGDAAGTAEGAAETAITIEDVKDGQLISGTDAEGEFEGRVISHTKKKLIVEMSDTKDQVELDVADIESMFLLEDVQAAPAEKPARAKTTPKTETQAPAKTSAKTPAKAAAKDEPKSTGKAKTDAKAAGKGKTGTQVAPTKGRAVAKAAPAQEEEDPDLKGMIILTEDQEDPDIVALVNDADDIVALANELIEQTSMDEYRLGGILYHVRLSKSYKDLDKAYAENKGFELFVEDRLGIGYRKAMYLIDIYTKFNLHGLGGDKVAELGWTKASHVAKYITEDNAEEILGMAETMTSRELGDSVKERFSPVGADTREKAKFTTFKFRLIESLGDQVKSILEQAALAQGKDSKKLDQVFADIITEWGMEHLHAEQPAPAKARTSAPARQAAPVPAGRAGRSAPARARANG